MPNPKVAIGVPFYGPQEGRWWISLAGTIAAMPNQGIDFGGLIPSGVSTPDINRNSIARKFLDSDAEWLYWIDADNPPPVGALPRLLAISAPFVSGVYYSSFKDDTIHPIAYFRKSNGAYVPIDDVLGWNRGEIISVHAVGMGNCLIHRKVYEDVLATHQAFYRKSGGIAVVHKDQVTGSVSQDTKGPYDGRVRKGVFYERLLPLPEDVAFPFYACQFGRTEDMPFCEMAIAAGHSILLDTSVEVEHIKPYPYSGKDYRKQKGVETEVPAPEEKVYEWQTLS